MRAKRVSKEIQAYDRQLVCVKTNERFHIKRRSKTYDLFNLNGMTLLVSRPFEHHIMSLTVDWQIDSTPTEWGIEPILARLRAMDLWSHKVGDELLIAYEKEDESKERSFKNNVESFLKDFRRQFGRTFNDVNTSTLAKIDKRRLRDGYCK